LIGPRKLEESVMRKKLRNQKRESGFSVMELCVAMAIFAILASMAIPGTSRWLPNYRIKSAARDLYSNFQLARLEAIRNNREHALVFNIGAGTYNLVSSGADGDYGTADDPPPVKTVTLSSYGSGINYGTGNAGGPIDAVRGFDDSVTFQDTADGMNILIFNARGMINPQTNTAGEVYITNQRNQCFAVSTGQNGVVVLREWSGGGWN
jgi:prepilin-type N-terminal cleavage/methylation domain-containing protein